MSMKMMHNCLSRQSASLHCTVRSSNRAIGATFLIRGCNGGVEKVKDCRTAFVGSSFFYHCLRYLDDLVNMVVNTVYVFDNIYALVSWICTIYQTNTRALWHLHWQITLLRILKPLSHKILSLLSCMIMYMYTLNRICTIRVLQIEGLETQPYFEKLCGTNAIHTGRGFDGWEVGSGHPGIAKNDRFIDRHWNRYHWILWWK